MFLGTVCTVIRTGGLPFTVQHTYACHECINRWDMCSTMRICTTQTVARLPVQGQHYRRQQEERVRGHTKGIKYHYMNLCLLLIGSVASGVRDPGDRTRPPAITK